MSDQKFVHYDLGWKLCEQMQKQAIAPITGTKVGACIRGIENGVPVYIGGFNIELSISYVYHAEDVALIHALKRKIIPQIVMCTSKSHTERIALCGNCRQKLLDANPDCRFIIFNPDGSVKMEGKISEFMVDCKSWGKIDWLHEQQNTIDGVKSE